LLTNNLIEVLKSINTRKHSNPVSINHIKTTTEDKVYTATIQDFLKEVETIVSRIPVNYEDQRATDFTLVENSQLTPETMGEFRDNQVVIHKSGMTMENHPRLKECLDSFINSLPPNSEHHLNEIIIHSHMCEFVTSFAVDNRVAIAVGFSLFVEIYPLMKQTGGLNYFFYSARDQIYYSKPFFNKLQILTCEYKYPLIIGTGAVISLIAFPELKTVIPNLLYSIPPSVLEVHLPSNEFAQDLYRNAFDFYKDLKREMRYRILKRYVYSLIGENIGQGVAFFKELAKSITK